jgi:hypothetical protein
LAEVINLSAGECNITVECNKRKQAERLSKKKLTCIKEGVSLSMETSVGKPTVMLLGTFHMRPSNDMRQLELDNLLRTKRQQEIREVVDRIKRYKPTKVAVEVATDKNTILNEQYKQYIDGNLDLEVNEVHQLGFRIAAESKHKRIYAID